MERRFSKRIPLGCIGSLLFSDAEVPVTVEDVSRDGIGFSVCDHVFSIKNDFNFQFIDDNGSIVSGHAILVRLVQEGKKIIIGCRHGGMDPDSYVEQLEIADAISYIRS